GGQRIKHLEDLDALRDEPVALLGVLLIGHLVRLVIKVQVADGGIDPVALGKQVGTLAQRRGSAAALTPRPLAALGVEKGLHDERTDKQHSGQRQQSSNGLHSLYPTRERS